MFRHPNYYKELRKLRNKLDQAISDSTAPANDSVRPGPGPKPQATSLKLQAASYKLHDSRTLKKFYAALTEGLDHDKCVVRMLNMIGNLMWTKPDFVTFCYL